MLCSFCYVYNFSFMNKCLLACCLAVVLFACKKDTVDEPSITRVWQIDKFYGAGVDSTVWFGFAYGGYTIDIRTGGLFTERYTPYNSPMRIVNGNWQLIDYNNAQYVQLQDSVNNRYFELLLLDNSNFKLKSPIENRQYWLKPQ